MVEDFGYQRDDQQSMMSLVIKRAFLIGAILFSISCFIYITINAYYFVYHEQNNDVTTIKSPDFPIKIIEEENKGGTQIKDMDKTVYENIVGNKRESLEKSVVNVVKVPEDPASPSAGKAKVTTQQNISTTPLINNQKVSDSKLVAYDSRDDFKTIDQSTKEHIAEKTASSLPATSQKTLEISGPKSKRNVSRVQLAAMNSAAAADDYWLHISGKYPTLFSGLRPFVQEVNLGQKGTFYRLQIGNFRSQVEAEDFCLKFLAGARKAKADCIVVE